MTAPADILPHVAHLPPDGVPYAYEIVFDSHGQTIGCRMTSFGCCADRAREQFEEIHPTYRVLSVLRCGAPEVAANG